MTDEELMASEVWRRGVEAATTAMANRPPPEPTISVSVDRKPERAYIKLCRGCWWGVKFCKCPR